MGACCVPLSARSAATEYMPPSSSRPIRGAAALPTCFSVPPLPAVRCGCTGGDTVGCCADGSSSGTSYRALDWWNSGAAVEGVPSRAAKGPAKTRPWPLLRLRLRHTPSTLGASCYTIHSSVEQHAPSFTISPRAQGCSPLPSWRLVGCWPRTANMLAQCGYSPPKRLCCRTDS